MKSLRLVLLGFVVIALAVCVWWYARPEPVFTESPAGPRAGQAQRQPEEKATVDGGNSRAIGKQAPAAIPPEEPDAVSAIATAPEIAAVLSEANRFERQHALERLGYTSGAHGFATAADLLSKITQRSDRAAFLRGVFGKLAEGEPTNALRALKELEPGTDREAGLATVIESWQTDLSHNTRRDVLAINVESPQVGRLVNLLGNPTLAAQVARELLSGHERAQVLGMAAIAMLERDPQQALIAAQEVASEHRGEVLDAIARAWGRRNGEAALAWAHQETDPAAREKLQAQALEGWSFSDPAQAAARVGMIADPTLRAELMESIASSWAVTDTAAALGWARGLPDPQLREQAMSSIQSSAPVGIGVSLRSSDEGLPVINELIPGGPASVSGALRPGYRIAAIADGRGGFTELKGMDLGQITQLVRGKPGTAAVLQVIPEGAPVTQRVVISIPRQQLLFKNPTGTP